MAKGSMGPLVPFAALSGAYFAHIGFFNPYLTLWLKDLGLPLAVISVLAAVQPFTRVFAPYIWGLISDRSGERVRLLRYSALAALVLSTGLWWQGSAWWVGAVVVAALVLWWLQNRGKNRHEYRDAVIEAERRKWDQKIDSWWTKRPPADS